jgi:hypothetical protein
MIIAGAAKDLLAAVHDQSTGAMVAAGTVYCVARLESADADDGKYWDGDSWEAAPATWPEATHLQAGQWVYALPSAATAGKAGATVHYAMTDDLDEAAATTVCGGGEHHVWAEDPLQASDLSNLDAAVSTRATPADLPSEPPSASAVADAVLDELLAGHVVAGSSGEALALIASRAAQGTGLRAVTLQLVDDQTPAGAVPNARVQVWDSGNATILHELTTDANGEAADYLDDGTYKLRIAPPAGYGATVPETLTVAGDAPHSFTLTKYVTALPSDPSLCRISGRLVDAGGNALGSTGVSFQCSVPQASGGNTMVREIVKATTAADGTFSVDLVRGASVAITCRAAGLDRTPRTVPNLATQDFETWA